MAILILINKTKAYNFNFHSFKSYCLSTTKIFLPFGLGHYRMIAEHRNFPPCTTAHFFHLSYGCTDAISWSTDRPLLQNFLPTEYKYHRTPLHQQFFHQTFKEYIQEYYEFRIQNLLQYGPSFHSDKWMKAFQYCL